MVDPEVISGRLGNKMFQLAFLYAYARKNKLELVDNGLGYYFQDSSYFEEFRQEIMTLFGIGVRLIPDTVAIHVRRGDYVHHPFYIDLSLTDYYEKAMQEFPNARFLVFSDDIGWCKEQKVFEGCDFIDPIDEITDFNTMAGCTGHIIANSTYSFWAAYVAPYTKKIVAPKLWYTDNSNRTVLPTEWIRL